MVVATTGREDNMYIAEESMLAILLLFFVVNLFVVLAMAEGQR